MGKCIFCLKETDMLRHGYHYVCSSCQAKPKIQKSEYCHTCYNNLLLNNPNSISVCKFSSLHQNVDLALCQNHAYCFECFQKPKNAKSIKCEFCLNSVQYFCISCRRYCEKNNMIRLHLNHNICNNCKNSNTSKLSCVNCRTKIQDDTVNYNPQMRLNFYYQTHDKLLNNKQSSESKSINLSQISTKMNSNSNINNHTKNSVERGNKKGNFKTLDIKEKKKCESNQNHNKINSQKSPEVVSNTLTNTTMVNTYNINQFRQPEMNNCYCPIHQQYYSLMACKDHPYCYDCIFYYLIKKFNQFIKNINANNLEWLNKFHKYGCYSQGCNKANYSCQFYQFLPYLRTQISEYDYQNHYLLNYFIPYSEGFNFVFNSCGNCKIKSAIYPENICYSCQCHLNSITTY